MKTAWSRFILRTNHDLLGGGLDLIGHELPSSIVNLDKNTYEWNASVNSQNADNWEQSEHNINITGERISTTRDIHLFPSPPQLQFLTKANVKPIPRRLISSPYDYHSSPPSWALPHDHLGVAPPSPSRQKRTASPWKTPGWDLWHIIREKIKLHNILWSLEGSPYLSRSLSPSLLSRSRYLNISSQSGENVPSLQNLMSQNLIAFLVILAL